MLSSDEYVWEGKAGHDVEAAEPLIFCLRLYLRRQAAGVIQEISGRPHLVGPRSGKGTKQS